MSKNEHILFYYSYASFTDAQLPLLKVAAVWFDKLVILDPIGASWDTIGADHIARDAVRQLKDAGILEIVTPATMLAKYEAAITAAIRRDIGDRECMAPKECSTGAVIGDRPRISSNASFKMRNRHIKGPGFNSAISSL